MSFTYNDPKLKHLRQKLRTSSTSAELILWHYLRKRRLEGYRFVRQYSVNRYILDFYCPEKRLGIELDGEHHKDEEIHAYDNTRTNFLQSYNIHVIRFWNKEVHTNPRYVLRKISNELHTRFIA
ncbi:MAG: endonuclease domain-containing protein [Candidatus Dojkabacteria bacterium]